ncbi:MAG: succinate dehydrogenase cytochrome b subunit [Kiritimatiellia bacterium]
MWFLRYLKSSVGGKQSMGAAGAALVAFLVGHLLGNLQLLNPDPAAAQAAYNAYTKFLTGLKPLIWFVEAGIAGVFAWHVAFATGLKLRNRKAAGPRRYAVAAAVGPSTPASYTMYGSGLVILLFVVLHLAVFKFGTCYLYRDADGELVRDMWLTTVLFFGNPVYTALYVLALLVVGAHLFHAIPSLFRTFGLDHPKWTPAFALCGWLLAVALGLGFAGTAAGTCALAHTAAGQAQIRKALGDQPGLARLKNAENSTP